MRRVAALAAVAALVGALVGCGEDGSADGPDATLNGSWTVKSITVDQRSTPLAAPASIEILDRRLRVETGCNMMSGEVTVADGKLIAKDLAQTEMGCEPDRMEQESRFAKLFGAEVVIDQSGPDMTLTGSGVVVALTEG